MKFDYESIHRAGVKRQAPDIFWKILISTTDDKDIGDEISSSADQHHTRKMNIQYLAIVKTIKAQKYTLRNIP